MYLFEKQAVRFSLSFCESLVRRTAVDIGIRHWQDLAETVCYLLASNASVQTIQLLTCGCH